MEPRGKILPVYFVADQSGSMYENLDELNNGLQDLLTELQVEVFAASKIRFSLIGFANETARYLENCDLTELQSMPQLSCGGLTAYGSCFGFLADNIPFDVQALKSQGYSVHRPAVFFLTDGATCGEPEGYWESEYQCLLSLREHPNILAFGIGDADPTIISQIATNPQYALIQRPGANTGTALASFVQSLTQSVINSGYAMGGDQPAELKVEKPDDFLTISVDEL